MSTQIIKPLVIKVSYDHIQSINSAYIPIRGNRLILSNDARSFKDTINNCLRELKRNIKWEEEYPWLKLKDLWIKLEIHVLFNKNFGSRDASNTIKLSEDCLASFLGINDSRNLEVSVTKFFVPSSPKEYLIFIVTPSQIDFLAYESRLKQSDTGKIEGGN